MGYSNLKMILKLIIIVAALALVAQTQPDGIDAVLTEDSMENDWENIKKFLNKQRVISFYHEGLSEESQNRVLSLQLPMLEELRFLYVVPEDVPNYRYAGHTVQVLTHRLIKTIFTSRYFPRLKVLNLKSVNLDNRSFRFLQNITLQTSLSELILQNNLISKEGFQYLSTIQFTNLTKLNVMNTLLKEEEAVDALIQLICGKAEGKCSSNLEKLSLGGTNIDRQHFIRLMNRINADPLTSLNLQGLNLIYERTYKEGFNFSAFEVLKRFHNLQELDLSECLINDEVASLYKDWKLPNLLKLNLERNHFTDEGIVSWINKKNMPSLSQLFLIQNEVSDGTLIQLAKQKFELTKLSLGACKLTAGGGAKLGGLRTESLESLVLEFNMPSKVLNRLIQKDQFPNLRSLTLIKNDFLVDAFTEIEWSLLEKLEVLELREINLKDSLMEIYKLLITTGQIEIVHESLKYLVLVDNQIAAEMINSFLLFAPIMFPQLQQLIIEQDTQMMIYPQALEKAEFNEGAFIFIDQLQLIKRANAYELISLPSPSFLFMSQNKAELNYESVSNRIPAIARKYEFSTLQVLEVHQRYVLDIFFRVIKKANIKSLPNLRSLKIFTEVDFTFLLNQLSDIEFPNLRQLALVILIPADTGDKQLEENVIPFLKRFTQLYYLYLDVIFLNEETGFVQKKWLLDSLYFPFLRELEMSEQNMEVEEVAGLIAIHNQTLRLINLGSNFMEKDFLKILIDNEYTPLALSLDSTSFVVEEFAILSQVHTEFLLILILSQNDLTNEHILAMLAQNKTGPYFPKLKYLNLQGNDIRKEGLEALLQTEMFELNQIKINKNSNPQFINLLFTYPTEVSAIIAAGIQVYGVQNDLSPLSTQNLQILQLDTRSFIPQDFHNLARLSFSRLHSFSLNIYNIYDCSVMADLLRMNEESQFMILDLRNDEVGLNSSCLKNTSFQTRGSYYSIEDHYGTSYLPEFVVSLLNTTSELKALILTHTKLHTDTFKKIFAKGNFNQLQLLGLDGNYIGDEGLKPLFKSDLSNLFMLDLSNTEISGTTVEWLSMANLGELQYLILSQNKFDERAMKSLASISADSLQVLLLSSCELNGQSLNVIASQFSFKSLAFLQLDYNNFEEDDVVEFVANIERQRFPSLKMISLKGISLSKENYNSVVDILTTKYIKYTLTAPHHILKVNSAHY